jgi:hypothetical protein
MGERDEEIDMTTDDTRQLREQLASNTPDVAEPTQLAAVLDRYTFACTQHGDLSVEVVDEDSLVLSGYDVGFFPVPDGDWDGADPDPARATPYVFLAEIAQYLDEPIVVQRIADEDGNYPLGAKQWIAHPGDSPEDVAYTSLCQSRNEEISKYRDHAY